MATEPEAQARAEIDRLFGLAGWNVCDAAETVGVKIVEHLIVSANQCPSFGNAGLL